MKIPVFIVLLLSSISVLANNHKLDWLPNECTYIPRTDNNYQDYATPSMHNTYEYSLTFDDGPGPYTKTIADMLYHNGIKATFFINTYKVTTKYKKMLANMIKQGHIIASHDHYHNHNNRIPEATFRYNLRQSFLIIKEIYEFANVAMTNFYFRFPYAEYGGHPDYHHMNVVREVSHELFGNNCIHFVFWDIDSGDWIAPLTAEQMFTTLKAYNEGGYYYTYKVDRSSGRAKIVPVKRKLKKPTFGGVILFHDIHRKTVHAVEKYVNYLKLNNLNTKNIDQIKEHSYQGLSCGFL
jgi:peptidoglycan/xylan/chitin deacetylase (PgdA/CDA1 family)